MTTAPLTTTTAAALREQLQQLQRERATAALDGDAAHRPGLTDAIEATRDAYIGAAVTEIAALRAELDGPLLG